VRLHPRPQLLRDERDEPVGATHQSLRREDLDEPGINRRREVSRPDDDGLACVEVLDAIRSSAAAGGARIEVERS